MEGKPGEVGAKVGGMQPHTMEPGQKLEEVRENLPQSLRRKARPLDF